MGVHPSSKLATGLATAVLVVGSSSFTWVARAQSGGTVASRLPVQTAQDSAPVPAPATSGDRGGAYHELERQATKVTMRFTDAIATAERTVDGQLVARIADLGGNSITTLRVRHPDAGNEALEFTIEDKPTRRVLPRTGLRPTLDWSNQQAYSLWKDRGALDGTTLEWQETMIRPRGAARRTIEAQAIQSDTEWQGGLSATVTAKTGTHLSYSTNQKVTGTVFISNFKKDGQEIGSSQWWPAERAFAWSFPGLTEGYVNDARLKMVGGWRLTPDMAWMNTQNLAFYQFHTRVKTHGSVSERHPGVLERLGMFFSPRLQANDAGCDYLHWLDGTIFRPCCDQHDSCYQQSSNMCSQSSWWMWWSSWSCDKCNLMAIVCFATANTHIYQRYP